MHAPATDASTVSDRKIRANRRNARKSTGPRTAEGKARSRMNASTHHLFCSATVLGGENEAQFKIIREGYLETLKPQNVVELAIVDRIVQAQWRLDRWQHAEMMMHHTLAEQTRKYAAKRIGRLQQKYSFQSQQELEAMCEDDDADDQRLLAQFKSMLSVATFEETPAAVTLAIALTAPPGVDNAGLVRLSLYEQRLEGTIHRNLRQLQKLRGNSDPRTWAELPESPFASRQVEVADDENEKLKNEPTADQSPTSADECKACEETANRGTGVSPVLAPQGLHTHSSADPIAPHTGGTPVPRERTHLIPPCPPAKR